MNLVFEQVNAVGEVLVRFAVPMLVQSSVLMIMLLLADFVLRKKVRAVFRYWLWMLVLVKLVLPSSMSSPVSVGCVIGDKLRYVSAEQLRTAENSTLKAEPLENAAPVRLSAVERFGEVTVAVPPLENVARGTAEHLQPPATATEVAAETAALSWQGLVFLAWLAVVVAMGLLLLQRAFFVRQLVAQARQAKGLLADSLEFCRRQMGVKTKIELKVSSSATSPAVCGLFRPVILLPANLAPSLGSRHLRAVLMHELAHIKRGDLWVNLLQTLLQIVYFYNPLLWVANAVIRRVREQAVDETVLVAMGEKARWYPETLVSVAKLAFERPVLSLRLIGVVESKNALKGRIKRILNRPMPKSAKLGIVGLIAILAIAVILLPMAMGDRETDASQDAEVVEKVITPEHGAANVALNLRTGEFIKRPEAAKDAPLLSWSRLAGRNHEDDVGLLAWNMKLDNVRRGRKNKPQIDLWTVNDAASLPAFLFRGSRWHTEFIGPTSVKWPYLAAFKGADGTIGVLKVNKVEDAKVFVSYRLLSRPRQDAENSKLSGTKFKAKLPNGVTVELLGVCEHPSEDKQWWRPDGSSLQEKPYGTIKGDRSYASSGEKAYEFVVRLAGAAQSDTKWVAIPSTGTYATSYPYGHDGKLAHDLRVLHTSFSEETRSGTIRFGLAAGPWQTVADTPGDDSHSAQGTQRGGVIFSKVSVSPYGTSAPIVSITVTDEIVNSPCRIIAITKDGQEVEPVRTTGGSAGKARQTTAYFEAPPIDKGGQADISFRKFLFQTRPYQWVTFKNVSLQPGVKSDVKVEIEYRQAKAKVTRTKYNLKLLHQKVIEFKLDSGRYPTEEVGLCALTEQPSDVLNYPRGGYVKGADVLKDAWGNEFYYERYPEGGGDFRIVSWGADGEKGGQGYDQDLYSTEVLKQDSDVGLSKTQSPLHLAVLGGHQETAAMLLSQGFDINAEDSEGNTPLHIAAANGHLGLVGFLIERGANVNAVNNKGQTPLHLAAQNGHQATAQLLIKRGADEKRQKQQAREGLQGLIDAAEAGSVVTLPAGVYTEPITIDKPLILKGASVENCVFQVTSNEPAIFVKAGQKGKVVIEDITVKWQLATSERSETPFAVAVRDCEAQVRNCRFYPLGNFKRCPVAIKSLGFSKLRIESCLFEGFEYTVCFGEGSEGSIADSVVAGSGHQGISLYSGSTASIVRNVVCNSRYHGVRSTGGTLNMRDNLVINNANRGVYLGNKSTHGVVENNVIMGSGLVGVSGFAQSDVKVQNNLIMDCGEVGVGLQPSCQLVLDKNVIMNNPKGVVVFTKDVRSYGAVLGGNLYWNNELDTENCRKGAGSLDLDPGLRSPEAGDFGITNKQVLQKGHGLTDPAVFQSLWQKSKMSLEQRQMSLKSGESTKADVPREDERQSLGSKLAFRVVPKLGADRQPSLTETEFTRYCKLLQSVGPEAGDQEHKWFEIRQDVKGDLPVRDYKSKRYVLLCSQPKYVMLPQQDWGLAKVDKGTDNLGRPMVTLLFDEKGAGLFYKLTSSNISKPLAVLIDREVISAPTVMTAIRRAAVIAGTFSEEEVEQMVETLRKGMPPVDAEPESIAKAPNEVRQVHGVLEAWFEGCLAGGLDVIKRAYSSDYQLAERDLRQMRELLQMNPGWRFSLVSVIWGEQEALAVSGALKLGDPKVEGPQVLVWTLAKVDGRWGITDIDLEEIEGLQRENSRFFQKHPNAQVWFEEPGPHTLSEGEVQ